MIVSLFPDHEADAFVDQSSKPHPWIIETLFGGFDNWDSQYYLTIAEKGYIHEQFLAFFPLYPFLMRVTAVTVLSPFTLFLPLCSVLLLSGLLLSNIFFILAAFLLYRLTLRLTSDHQLSLYSSFFFCLNPASVFMCSSYSESLFVCLCFGGMLAIATGKSFLACLLFALATATRSNGMFTAGFILYFHVHMYISSTLINAHLQTKLKILQLIKQFVHLTVQVLVVLSPFVLFQAYSYRLLCHKDMSIISYQPGLCNHTVPISYSYLQEKHWDLGFLRYYQIKQIPNFLLALPMIVLVVASIVSYLSVLPPAKRLVHLIVLERMSKGL